MPYLPLPSLLGCSNIRVEMERVMACVVASRREKNRAYFFDRRRRYCRIKLVPIRFQSMKHQWARQIKFIFLRFKRKPRSQLKKTTGHVSVCSISEKSFEVAVLETKFKTYRGEFPKRPKHVKAVLAASRLHS